MATSQNGWTVIESGTDDRLVAIPRIVGRVRAGDVAAIFIYLNERFDADVEDIDAGRDDWGWAFRPIAGNTSGYSNHASGTAEDLNATKHPLGAVGTFTKKQLTSLRSILDEINRDAKVIRWGGDYTGRKDEMHFEIVGTEAQVAAAAARLTGTPAPPAIPAKPVRNVAETIATQKAVRAKADGDWGDDTDNRVNLVRAALNGRHDAVVQGVIGTKTDGIWGPKSKAALVATVKALQRAWGTNPDGIWGAKTEAAWVAARTRNYKNW